MEDLSTFPINKNERGRRESKGSLACCLTANGQHPEPRLSEARSLGLHLCLPRKWQNVSHLLQLAWSIGGKVTSGMAPGLQLRHCNMGYAVPGTTFAPCLPILPQEILQKTPSHVMFPTLNFTMSYAYFFLCACYTMTVEWYLYVLAVIFFPVKFSIVSKIM